MSSRPRSNLEQSRKNIVGAVVELDRLNIGEARGALDTDDFRYATGETQTVTGVIAGENGGIRAGAAIDLVGARSAVDRVVALSALDIIGAAARVENIVPGATIDAVIAVAAEDYVVAAQTVDDVPAGDRPGQNIIAFRAVERL